MGFWRAARTPDHRRRARARRSSPPDDALGRRPSRRRNCRASCSRRVRCRRVGRSRARRARASGASTTCSNPRASPRRARRRSTSSGPSTNSPRFDEKIATYSNTKSAYKKIIATHQRLPHPDRHLRRTEISGTVQPGAFRHFGNASASYAMTVSDSRGTLHYYYLIVRKGSVLGAFLEGQLSRGHPE